MSSKSRMRLLFDGVIAMLPLNIAILPWGFLAGSYAIEVGLHPVEGQLMSVVMFAGAGQLALMGMIFAGANLMTILMTIFFVTSRHLLYSVAVRAKVVDLPTRWRVILGFLLTDELFAIIGHQSPKQFQPWYAFGAGFSFYLIWNIATTTGIVAGSYLPDLDKWGLEFAVAAMFIGIVVPHIRSLAVIVCAIVALITSVAFSLWQIEGALMFSSLIAMAAGYTTERFVGVTK
ncbi:AzlC family ABC transporter permease [Vibrio sp. SM6]|uniref:AzlC family ABC transporter permease n=1 Tax=Vibrio agarilyticus TaxID=2726741 RepID=A0A7X8YHX4_9VIBR|nr:AzlC family ABC transporter permease [Vibrio agarilyticus]NLS14558.1 AzlC family ABC transporter permease [Vibrio agarilyticus]